MYCALWFQSIVCKGRSEYFVYICLFTHLGNICLSCIMHTVHTIKYPVHLACWLSSQLTFSPCWECFSPSILSAGCYFSRVYFLEIPLLSLANFELAIAATYVIHRYAIFCPFNVFNLDIFQTLNQYCLESSIQSRSASPDSFCSDQTGTKGIFWSLKPYD